jgi:hypothetical protein
MESSTIITVGSYQVTVSYDGVTTIDNLPRDITDWDHIVQQMGQKLAEVKMELRLAGVKPVVSTMKKEINQQTFMLENTRLKKKCKDLEVNYCKLAIEKNNLKLLNRKLIQRIKDDDTQLKQSQIDLIDCQCKQLEQERNMHEAIRKAVQEEIRICMAKVLKDNQILREDNQRLQEDISRLTQRLDKYDMDKATIEARLLLAQFIFESKCQISKQLQCKSWINTKETKTDKEITDTIQLLFGLTPDEWNALTRSSEQRNQYCHPDVFSIPQKELDNAMDLISMKPQFIKLIRAVKTINANE